MKSLSSLLLGNTVLFCDQCLVWILVTFQGSDEAALVNSLRRQINDADESDTSSSVGLSNFCHFSVPNNKDYFNNCDVELFGSLLASPKPKPNLKQLPYVIGLTGGIASGKSSVCDYLTRLGAKCIYADEVGHYIYETDNVVRGKLKETFGVSVFNEAGQVDRKKLARIVFHDQVQLNKLNSLVWPAILNRLKEMTDNLARVKNVKVIFIEAAVLTQANWQNYFHEIWSCIIPENEAINRLHWRNNLTEDEALARISRQPTNEDYVENSNVILCTLWNTFFTQLQIQKAWNGLRRRL